MSEGDPNSTLAQANDIHQLIEGVVRSIMDDIVIPKIERMVEERIHDAVYHCVQRLDAAFVRGEIRRSVTNLIGDRIEITIKPPTTGET